GGPRLWLSPQCGHGGAPAGRRGGADPPGDLPPGHRGGPAPPCAGLAAATGGGPAGGGPPGAFWPAAGCPAACPRPSSRPRSPAPPRPGRAGRRPRRKAQKAGRTITTPTLAVAGWLLLITTLAAATGATADVL